MSFSSKLGDALYPPKSEDTFFDMEARSIVSEILYKNNGNIDSAEIFLEKLESYIPDILQNSIDNPSWSTERELDRWHSMTKALIRRRLIQFFALEL
ncbi:hypothetical protein V2A84_00120 [Yersinia sp. 2553 StPb PI]|uniref:hypothetical protein n=1 Tax=Yersinia sp. 2553 StPb PI TaxID=3117411 RepID=UPI003FA4647F